MTMNNGNKKTFSETIAIVDYWPEIENAETECILRISSALEELNCQCVVINRHGYLTDDPNTHVDEISAKFVIALHFDTAKCWDTFTYYGLWNPLDFYFQWNYREKSQNVISNDAFLSCGSNVADDHARRLLSGVGRVVQSEFPTLYHGVHDPVLTPSLGRQRLFYCGINWEAISGKGGRHHELLKLLDEKGVLDIYGPEVFQGVKVWDGYSSYQGSIPFDGKTLISKVAKSGIGLVLSSQSHINSGLMSSRLFECLSAGVPVICDENPFAKSNFGNLLYYIDASQPPHLVASQIIEHVEYIKENSQLALEKAKEAQDIYLSKFSLKKNLTVLLRTGNPSLDVKNTNSGSELYSIFIADECDHHFMGKLNRFADYVGERQDRFPVVILPEGTSVARVNDIHKIFSAVTVIFYDKKEHLNAFGAGFINVVADFIRELKIDSIVHIVPPWENPGWRIVDLMCRAIDDDDELDFVSAGYTVKENCRKPNEGKAIFEPSIKLDKVLDANYPFAISSCVFKKNKIFDSVLCSIRYTPYFWGRLMYASYQKNGNGLHVSFMASVYDFDGYVEKFRLNSHEQLFRETEIFIDVLGFEFVNERLRGPAVIPAAQIDPISFVNSLDVSAAQVLVKKLYKTIKLPSVMDGIVKWMWKKGQI